MGKDHRKRRAPGGLRLRGAARQAGKGGRSGFALVEVMVGAGLLSLAMSSLLLVLISYARTVKSNRERAVAQEAARELLERMRAVDFPDLFAEFNQVAGDDPSGAGNAHGGGFAVGGLDPQEGDADGMAGEILFPVANAGVLSELVNDRELGMPSDLDGDGAANRADVTLSYVVLPVRIRIRWSGARGNQEFVLTHLLTDR